MFCIISIKLDASISFVQTDFAIHIYAEENGPSILSIPMNGSEFIQIAEVDYTIKEKLGSYNVEKNYVHQSENFKVSNVTLFSDAPNQQTNFGDNLAVDFEIDFKGKVVKGVLDIRSSANLDLATHTLHLSHSFTSKVDFEVIHYNIPKNYQAVYGGGIQFSNCNLKGQKFPLIVEENGVGRGDKGPTFWANLLGAAGNTHTTYAPTTNFLTDDQLQYHFAALNAEHYWEVDFTSNNLLRFQLNYLPSINKLRVSSFTISHHLEKAKDVEISKEKKRPYPILEDWMFQYILGIQGGKQKVNAKLNDLQDQGIHVGAIWIQDWVGKRQTSIGSRLQWDWRPNENVYPNLKAWIDSLHQENIKVLGYINPYFVEGGEQALIGLEKDYFVKTAKEEAYKFKAGGFNAYMIDLNNPEAKVWMQSIIQTNLIDNGFDGWMCDFGEWFPLQGFSRENWVDVAHNNFPVEWVRLNQDLNTDDNFFIFNRSWYGSGTNAPPIMWLGDQMGNFGENDGLGSAVNAYNSASLSGFPLVHSDIGGYTAIKLGPIKDLRNDEVLQRWIEMECFTPLWRSHEGLKPEDMSQIYQDEKMMQFFAYFDSIHNELIPYFKTINQAIIDTEYSSFVQHPFLLYPDDPNTLDLQYQFFVGEDLLVCPVIVESRTKVWAYLPEGEWQHFFTGEIYTGRSWYEFDAPIGRPVAFWRKG